MGDLQHPGWMHLKGVLFIVILLISLAVLLVESFSWKNVALLGLIIWASARFYYYMFYVIERYVDPTYRFSGLWDFFWRYLLKQK